MSVAISTGLIIAGGIAAAGSVASGIIGSNAATDAASTQANAALSTIPITQGAVTNAQGGLSMAEGNAIPWTEEGLQGANQNTAPYAAAGPTAVANLEGTSPFSFSPQDLQNTPGYQFTLQQGLKAVDEGAASRGMAASGGTIKGEQNYAAGLASTTYQNAFQNALSTFNTNQNAQFNLANLGYSAASQQASNTINQTQWAGNTALSTAQQQGNWALQGAGLTAGAITGAANATAAGTVGSANAWSNALGGVSNATSGVANNYALSQLFRQSTLQSPVMSNSNATALLNSASGG